MTVLIRLKDMPSITLETDAALAVVGKQISESIKAGGLLDVADEYGNHHWLNPSIILEVVERAEPVTPDVRPQRTDLPKPESAGILDEQL